MWNTIRNMLFQILALGMLLLPTLERIAFAFDSADLTFLIILAIGVHFVAQQFVRDRVLQELAARCCWIVMIGYFVHRYRIYQPSSLESLLTEVGRSLIVTWFCYGPFLLTIPVLHKLVWQGINTMRQLFQWFWRLITWVLAMRHVVTFATESATPPQPTDSLASRLAIAKDKYFGECSLIRTAGLTPHEEEALLTTTKQRYLKNIKELIS